MKIIKGIAAILCGSALIFVSQVVPATACEEQSQYKSNTCLSAELEKAEIDLRYSYGRAIEFHSKNPTKSKLIEAQRAWLAYRAAQCSGFVESSFAGGMGQWHAVANCELALITVRIKELKNWGYAEP